MSVTVKATLETRVQDKPFIVFPFDFPPFTMTGITHVSVVERERESFAGSGTREKGRKTNLRRQLLQHAAANVHAWTTYAFRGIQRERGVLFNVISTVYWFPLTSVLPSHSCHSNRRSAPSFWKGPLDCWLFKRKRAEEHTVIDHEYAVGDVHGKENRRFPPQSSEGNGVLLCETNVKNLLARPPFFKPSSYSCHLYRSSIPLLIHKGSLDLFCLCEFGISQSFLTIFQQQQTRHTGKYRDSLRCRACPPEVWGVDFCKAKANVG